MKKVMSIAAVALMMAGSYAYACSSCGCQAKGDKAAEGEKTEKAEKSGCSSCSAGKKA